MIYVADNQKKKKTKNAILKKVLFYWSKQGLKKKKRKEKNLLVLEVHARGCKREGKKKTFIAQSTPEHVSVSWP